jgi:hypothetical protein
VFEGILNGGYFEVLEALGKLNLFDFIYLFRFLGDYYILSLERRRFLAAGMMIILNFVKVDEMDFIHECSRGKLLIFLDEKAIEISLSEILIKLKVCEDIVKSIVMKIAKLLDI